jgi:peptide/nickel transport system permease protein
MIFAILQRLVQMIFVMFGISMLVFLIFFGTPGVDPAARIAGRNASPEVLEAVRISFGFDQPFYIQYLTMMEKIFVTGDLTSFVNRGWKVVPAVMDTIPVTLSLVMGAAVLWVVFAIIIGVTAAAYRDRWPDKLLMILGLIGISMPVFWLGEVMNLSPRGIREHLKLNRPIYARTSAYGHFGRAAEADGGFSWERTDLVSQLKSALA